MFKIISVVTTKNCDSSNLFLDKVILMRYVNFCNGDVEQAKQLIDDGYTLRNKYPHVFMERDPTSEIAKQSFENIT